MHYNYLTKTSEMFRFVAHTKGCNGSSGIHWMKTCLFLALLAFASGASAQLKVDYSKYPDYSPVVHPDYSLMQRQTNGNRVKSRVDAKRPDHVNNAETAYFPAVFNQAGGSCGSASRIGYMFTHEINSYRGADASLEENQYPTHFTWLLTNSSSGKEGMAAANGIPNRPTYGGLTYSTLFGNQDCSANDFGWMQGYDKWYEAMQNRISHNANFPATVGTAEGREAVKNWIWNHNGDTDFHSGGICGIGVASSLSMGKIPTSAANTAAGVVGMNYVTTWGKSVDHALTIVGYDDRIEFDLDGNGVAGETSKDEVGAWIIVNSWGNGWANKGFIYCPYKYGCPVGTSGDYWRPEVYYVRKNYRPLRTIKIKMDYSRRSELSIGAGIASDTSATQPEEIIKFEHFNYAGDGDGNSTDAETPMLGRWADGMHYEPMEFGYDLTDLSSKFDTHKPLKYFFIIDTKSAAAGTGTIHKCSIIDYELDRQGIEVPFNIPASGVTIQNKGTRTIISMVVTGEPFNAPRNLTLADHTMTWQQPQTSSYTVSKYNIYQNNTLYASTEAGTTSFVIPDDSTAIYSVSAVYSINGNDLESGKSNAVRLPERVTKSADVLLMSNAGFTIPDIFNDKYSNVTIEYWLKPTSLTDWNQQIGPNWGQFLMHVTANKEFVAGWNTGYDRFFTPTNSISAGQWYHFAIVVSGNKMTAYINGVQKGTVTSEHFTGLGGFGDLTVGSHSSNNYGMYGRMDEMRIWKEARTPEQIRAYMNTEIANPTAESNLMAYYKMDMVKENGVNKLRDCARGHNATLVGGPIGQIDSTLLKGNTTLKAAFTMPSGAIYQGQSVTFTNASSANVASWAWNIPAAGIKNLNVSSPEVTFPQSGKFDVSLRVSDNKGNTADTTATVMVEKLGAPVAAFHLATDTTIYAGQHISFVNTSTGVGCTYEWTIQSADPERCVTTNAAATFLTAGTHTVTLKVTNAAGTSSVSHDVTVEKAAPEVAFNVRPDVVIKGETAYLEDKTKYEPTSWNWILDSDNFAMSMKGQNSSFVPTTPGVYDVSLSTSNEIGNNTLTRKRALTVCNADAMTGLKFGGTGETVTFAGLFASESKAFTIDWWMYPTQLKTDCDAMGDSESTFLIKTDETGAMHFCINGKSAVTDAGFVTPMQWHHYAIAFRNGVPMFYKDGVQWNKSSNIDYAARICPALANGFKIGSSTAPMNAVIDELHIWNKYLTLPTIQAYSNAPITNIDSVTTADNLVLYCNFNQSSGNVKDASKNSYVGVRSGFGPEGDAWCSSKGVFCLNFDNSGKNVTVNYLTNYVMPFRHSSTYVTGTSRFYGLETGTTTSTWVLDNQVKVGSVTTGLYVDQQKDYAMTVATSWDGFSNNLTDHKAYQTITLPAGAYELTTEPYTEFSADGSYLAVAAGAGLPDTKNLATDAIGFSMLNTKSLKFILPEEKQVSLGVIINMSGQNCCTFKQFNLLTKPFAVITADGHTGIESTQNSSAVTFHAYSRDGQLVMSTALPQRVTVYNLQGQRIYDKMVSGSISLSLPKGIYIVNQHKYLIH